MNPDAPTVSILIPTYNYACFLPQAIDSALAQTVKPLEIVVADDGSTDDTAAVVARYGAAVTYRRFNHSGACGIRQAMFQELKGEWFLNLDADNWIEPDFLEKALAVVAAHRGEDRFAFVYSDYRRFGEKNGLVEVPEFEVARLKRGNYLDMNSLIRLEPVRQVGLDLRFSDGQEDYDLFISLVEMGYFGARLPGGLLHYRVHAGSLCDAARKEYRQVEFAERILAKHAAWFSGPEAETLRRNARRGACVQMWEAVGELHAGGDDRQAVELGWRALRLGRRQTSRESAKLFFRALAAWSWRGIRRGGGRTESGM